jgi:mannose/fructose/N-acetylgalactosamine-specific phosphotransferase system component IIB
MEIAFLRVDERLVHGQITMFWTRRVGANLILAINDAVAGDPMQKTIMEFAAPANTDLEILSIAETMEKIKANAWPNKKALLLVKTPIDVLRLIDLGLKLEFINVGGVRQPGANIKLTKEVLATQEELEAWKKLDAMGIKIEVQWVPGERSTNLNDALKKYK